ncbi:resistance protein [Streptomyces litmocidini]|uniref:TerD family protein n=1 Tax=Streptomyces litmocidini TaxID=67318 RepID=UPI00167EB8F0|nr:TerD family protein [Streptomyces litmocidini]GGU86029.1 resistance protein [Streptomyces litmocidini]
MTEIVKGGNLPVPGQAWRIAVVRRAAGEGVPEVEASALLLDASGRVRGDGDLVFYNQLTHASGAVRLTGRVRDEDQRVADWLEIDTERVEPAVQRIVITASVDGGTFGRVPGLHIRTISATTGEQLALYEVDDASTETAFVLGEFYRRDGGWKFRAVGQGYDSGLVGLAEDYGVVGGDPEPAPDDEPASDDEPAPDDESAVGALPEAIPEELLAKVREAEAASDDEPAPDDESAVGALPEAIPEELLAKVREAEAAPARIPAQVPVRRPARVGPQSDVDLFGEDFPEFVRSGRGAGTLTVDVPIPAGYVLVDSARKGDGYFGVDSLDEHGKADVLLANTTLEDHEGRGLLRHDGRNPLRLRVNAHGSEWTIAVRPVSTVEELGRDARGRGADVLLHTGPAGLLSSRLHTKFGHAYFHVQGHEPGGRDHLLANVASRLPRDARPLPEGPLLVQVRSAEGDWSLKVRPPKENRFWRRAAR